MAADTPGRDEIAEYLLNMISLIMIVEFRANHMTQSDLSFPLPT